ncbi:MAG: hypothetical protein LAP40_23575 [Acidobacteriia bacterium]|nr:hypothetical protein [Terriglobia bacterium]
MLPPHALVTRVLACVIAHNEPLSPAAISRRLFAVAKADERPVSRQQMRRALAQLEEAGSIERIALYKGRGTPLHQLPQADRRKLGTRHMLIRLRDAEVFCAAS